MKFTILILIAINSTISFGQQLEFNGELVDSIFIKSHMRASNISGKKDVIGEANVFSIAFDTSANEYILDEYYEDIYSLNYNPDTLYLKVKDLKSKIKTPIDFKDLSGLLIALNNTADTPTILNQIDTTYFKEYVCKKRIRKHARHKKNYWCFKRPYSTKEENNLFFESCRSIDSLTLFINKDLKTKGRTVISSYSNTFSIWITTKTSGFNFYAKYPGLVKQPWFYKKNNSRELALPESIVNLKINNSLIKILPSDFFLIETLYNEVLLDDYMGWCLTKYEMK